MTEDAEQLILLNPGPANTSAAVKQAMLRGDWCHREREFVDLLAALRSTLPRALGVGATHDSVLITGSGTAAMESAVLSAVRPGRALLALSNGVYGQRLAQMAERAGIAVHLVESEWTVPMDPTDVRRALVAHPDIDAVSYVQHETTTGLVNPVRAITDVVQAERPDAITILDAISATAAEVETMAAGGADVIGGTANKGLHGLPGMSFLLVNGRGEDRMRAVPPRSVYLDPLGNLDAQRRGSVSFTPAVQVCFALTAALAELEERGGVSARIAEYRRRAVAVRTGLRALGLVPIVDQAHRASSVSMFPLPEGWAYDELHDALRARGFVVYAGQGKLAERHFRVATMGELDEATIERFVAAMAATLR